MRNLTLLSFLGLAAGIGGLIFAIYIADRIISSDTPAPVPISTLVVEKPVEVKPKHRFSVTVNSSTFRYHHQTNEYELLECGIRFENENGKIVVASNFLIQEN